jgi:hypothetical protein
VASDPVLAIPALNLEASREPQLNTHLQPFQRCTRRGIRTPPPTRSCRTRLRLD